MKSRNFFVLIASLFILLIPCVAHGATKEKVTIYRDEFGVPHVLAESNWGVFYGAGYAMAQDRLMQMHQFRLLAEGRLAEAAGIDYLASDCQVRRDLGGRSETEAVLSRIGKPYSDWLQAQADGINQAIADAGLQGMIEPWSPVDTVALNRYIVWDFCHGRVAETERLNTLNFLQNKFDKAMAENMWRDLMSPVDPDAITTIPAAERRQETHLGDLLLECHASGNILLKYNKSARPRLGSNAIVVSGKRSATGNPLLVSNTQLEVHFPAVYYEVHLKGGDFDVMGFTMPGFPPVGFGHNNHMAWTITVGCSDQQDIYEETVRMGPGNVPQYLFKGEWLDCAYRKEKIKIKGQSEPVTLSIYSTVHGPVKEFDFENGRAYTTKWSRSPEGHNLIAFFELDRAKTMEEFAKALSKVEMSFNFLYADIEGNIAYWHAGELPLRVAGHSGVMPVSGTGEYEWKGFVPFEQLPHYINPKEGMILLENNKPAPESPEYSAFLMNWGTQRIERMQQLADRLPEKATMADLEAILEDTHYLIADKLKPELLSICSNQLEPRIKEATRILKDWDNTISADSTGATIFFVWLQNVSREMLMDEFGDHCVEPLVEKPHLPIIVNVFRGKDAKLPPSRDYFDNITTPYRETKKDIVVVSMEKALDYCEKYFGTDDMKQWRWGEFSYWPLGPLGKVPNLYMDPNRHHTDIIGGGASSELIEAAPGFPNARNLMPPGNSGNAESPHAKDQLQLFVNFDYKPMLFSIQDVSKRDVSKQVLEIEHP
jgi:penicillin amidase